MDKARKNFDKKVKMHLACAKKESLRPIMACIYFKDGFAYATDGIVLVKNRLSEMSSFDEAEIQALDCKFLPADFYKDMLKYDECLISDEGIECHKDGDKAFFYFADFGDSKYPNADVVLQDALNAITVPLPQIGFRFEDMQRLSKALHDVERCTATFKGVNKPIVFSSIEPDVSSIGLLMPILITEGGES